MPEKIDPKREKLIQQKYAELYQIDMNIRQIQQQIEAVNQQFVDVESVVQNLEDLKDIDKNQDAACMFTPGIFIKTKILDTDKVLLNVGAGTVVEKTVADAQKLLKSQSFELKALSDDLILKLESLTVQARTIQEAFQSL